MLVQVERLPPGRGEERRDVAGEVTATAEADLHRLESALPPAHVLIGGAPVFQEVQLTTRLDDAAQLGERGRGTGLGEVRHDRAATHLGGERVQDVGLAPGRTDLSVYLGPDSHTSFAGVPSGTYYLRLRGGNEFGGGRPSAEIVMVVR